MVLAGCLDHRALIHAERRRGEIIQRLCLLDCPVTGNPAKTVIFGRPITWLPASLGGHVAPNTADPNEIIKFCIPSPISRYPLNVRPVGLVFRGQLLNVFGGLAIHKQIGRGIVLMRRRIGFVQLTASQKFFLRDIVRLRHHDLGADI